MVPSENIVLFGGKLWPGSADCKPDPFNVSYSFRMIPVSDEAGSRTLYLRFKNKFPATEDEVKDLHPSIVGVRVPRKGRKKKQIKYCFIDIKPEAEKKEVGYLF